MTTKEAVHPSEIETHLGKLWDELQGSGKMRACLFNLVIYAKKDQRVGYMQLVAQTIIKRFPSRIISVLEDPEKESSSISSTVSVVEVQDGVFCDLIEIEVSSDYHNRVPFVILPHLLPDLPIYLVWGCDPVAVDPISFKIESFATRTIFDSETADDLSAFSAAVISHMEKTGCEISDLNWARIESWRNLFASLFYTDQLRQKLQGAKLIEIVSNCRETPYFCHTKTQSFYIATWIAHIMGWKFLKKEGLSLHFENGLEIRMSTGNSDKLPPGRILGIEIHFDNNEKIRLHRSEEMPHHVAIEECESDACKILSRVVFEKESSGTSLVNEVCHTTTSEHFLAVSRALQEMNLGAV